MQDRDTILGVIAGRAVGVPYRILELRYGISAGSITRIMQRMKALKKKYEELAALPEEELVELFYPSTARLSDKIIMPDFEPMCRRLAEKGSRLNMSALWYEELEAAHEEGRNFYCYTQFTKHLKEYIEKTRGPQNLKMLIERVPGERVYVDWAGDQLELLLNETTMKLEKVHTFCATLGVSSYGYNEVFRDEKLPSFIQGVVHALEYFGGVPKYIVPDNLKSAVTKNTRDQLVLTSACRDLQEHFGVIILPPPPRKPTGKATVERWVGFTEIHYLEALKKMAAETPFTSIPQINEAGRQILDKLNSRIERGRKYSRLEIFERVDRPHLRPLPDEPFVCWQTLWAGRVPPTYHISFEGHRYSVPYTCVNKDAILKASVNEVVITDKANQLLARHPRIYSEFPQNITDPTHLAPSHQFWTVVHEWDGARYRKWASDIGENTARLVDAILASADHEEQMYERMARVMMNTKEAPGEVVEEAARWCLENKACLCSQFTKAVSRLMNERKTKSKSEPVDMAGGTMHENVRGKDYYE